MGGLELFRTGGRKRLVSIGIIAAARPGLLRTRTRWPSRCVDRGSAVATRGSKVPRAQFAAGPTAPRRARFCFAPWAPITRSRVFPPLHFLSDGATHRPDMAGLIAGESGGFRRPPQTLFSARGPAEPVGRAPEGGPRWTVAATAGPAPWPAMGAGRTDAQVEGAPMRAAGRGRRPECDWLGRGSASSSPGPIVIKSALDAGGAFRHEYRKIVPGFENSRRANSGTRDGFVFLPSWAKFAGEDGCHCRFYSVGAHRGQRTAQNAYSPSAPALRRRGRSLQADYANTLNPNTVRAGDERGRAEEVRLRRAINK